MHEFRIRSAVNIAPKLALILVKKFCIKKLFPKDDRLISDCAVPIKRFVTMQGTHVHHKNRSKNNETVQDERCTQDNCVGCIIYEHAMYDKGTQQNCVWVASGIRLSLLLLLFLVAEAVLATVAS